MWIFVGTVRIVFEASNRVEPASVIKVAGLPSRAQARQDELGEARGRPRVGHDPAHELSVILPPEVAQDLARLIEVAIPGESVRADAHGRERKELRRARGDGAVTAESHVRAGGGGRLLGRVSGPAVP
jgi:hypothetical protein